MGSSGIGRRFAPRRTFATWQTCRELVKRGCAVAVLGLATVANLMPSTFAAVPLLQRRLLKWHSFILQLMGLF